jgi:hypothetical protein
MPRLSTRWVMVCWRTAKNTVTEIIRPTMTTARVV